MTMRIFEVFEDRAKAIDRAARLNNVRPRTEDLYVIASKDKFYVENGTPFVRVWESVIWKNGAEIAGGTTWPHNTKERPDG